MISKLIFLVATLIGIFLSYIALSWVMCKLWAWDHKGYTEYRVGYIRPVWIKDEEGSDERE